MTSQLFEGPRSCVQHDVTPQIWDWSTSVIVFPLHLLPLAGPFKSNPTEAAHYDATETQITAIGEALAGSVASTPLAFLARFWSGWSKKQWSMPLQAKVREWFRVVWEVKRQSGCDMVWPEVNEREKSVARKPSLFASLSRTLWQKQGVHSGHVYLFLLSWLSQIVGLGEVCLDLG